MRLIGLTHIKTVIGKDKHRANCLWWKNFCNVYRKHQLINDNKFGSDLRTLFHKFRNTKHPDQTLTFPNLWLGSRGRSVLILRFERQRPTTGWLSFKQNVSLIYWCVFCIFLLRCVSFNLSQDCLPLLIAYQCIKPTTFCKPEKMKVSLIVLFSHSSLSFSVTGIFLAGKWKVSFHLDVKQI